MKVRRKAGLTVMAILSLTGVISAIVAPWDTILEYVCVQKTELLRIRLLSGANHLALLEAGRAILGQVSKDYLDTSKLQPVGDLPLPRGVCVPQAIRDLRPRGIYLNCDGYLTIEMHGGIDHFGVCIYPDDFREPCVGFKYGDRELLKGLWYYDENYRYGSRYDETVQEMLRGQGGSSI